MWRMAFCIAVAAVLPYVFNILWYTAVFGGILLYLITAGWRWVRLVFLTLRRDISFIMCRWVIQCSVRKLIKLKMTVGDIFSEQASLHPGKKAFVSAETGNSLTFKEADDLANRIANIFYAAGYRKGDVVAIIMENRIEYLPIWIGLSKIGVISSLINFNLRGDSLKHCLTVSKCKAVIFSAELAGPLKEIEDNMNIEFYCFEESYRHQEDIIENVKYLETLFVNTSTSLPPRPDNLSLGDELLYIYTSGTTGLPKAAIIRGFRAMFICVSIGTRANMVSDDVIYNALPLYHSNGGLGLAGNTIRLGCTLVIRKKFSASRYFEDCCKNDVTVINYIGETCRYLLATPPKDSDKTHKVRVAIGNGLRASIWKEFQDRFNIPFCMEFYGATEGNANMINTVGRVGAVGFNSVIFPWILSGRLIKVDKDTGRYIYLYTLYTSGLIALVFIVIWGRDTARGLERELLSNFYILYC